MKTYYSNECGKWVLGSMQKCILVLVAVLLPHLNGLAAEAPVDLGTAENFAVLAGPAVSSTQGGTINGDVGVSPGNTFTPGSPAVTINGVLHLADAVSLQGENDLIAAYNDAAGRLLPVLVAGGELGGLVLTNGLYRDDGAPASLGLTGTLTLDAQGDPNAVWIFQSYSTLIAEVNSRVVLTNGAQACKVFWQVGSSATLRTGTIFKGNILALSAITLENQATLEGRALARNAAVTLDDNTISLPVCGQSSSNFPGFTIQKALTNEYFYTGTVVQRPPLAGEVLNFVITIVNTGNVDLVTVPVRDVYDTNLLQYVDATPASVDNVNDGVINWADVGPLVAGGSTSIVANFVALCSTNLPFGTNIVVASPTTATNMPPTSARMAFTPYEIGRGILGDTVWNDLNANGIPDEDLTVYGLDGVTVRLYDISNNATNFLAQTVTATAGGQSGFYQFYGLAGGTNKYWVVADKTTVPLTLPVNTTPLGVPVQLTSCGSFYDADFGFIAGVASNVSDFAITKTLTNVYYYSGTTNARPPEVGEALNFVITIVNTGSVDLLTVPLADVYDTALLEYVDATPASVDNVNDGVINWTNVGPLIQGASTSIVVNFIAVCASTNEPFGTNTVIASPTAAPNGPQPAPGLAFAPYEIAHGFLGDTVWVDVNGNGLPDENLAIYGLNGIMVRLYEIVSGSTNFLAQTVTATVDGQRGYYQFVGLPYGTNAYWVRVVKTTVPATLPVNTTPLSLLARLTECGSFYDADFGFMADTPTVVELVDFRAESNGDRVLLSWATLMERSNAGFNLYRATEVDGLRTKINAVLIPGAGDGSGRSYQVEDPSALANGTYYYWIEDVEIDGVSTLHGPARVSIGLDISKSVTIGAAPVKKSGLYMITADTFRRSGMQPASVDPTRLRIYVDGAEVAAYVTTELTTWSDLDYMVFYAPLGNQASFGYAEGQPVRMPYRFVFPVYGEGEVWIGSLGENTADIQVTMSQKYVRYLITGFHEDMIWLLDVTDATLPSLLLGAELLQAEDEIGMYFSEAADGVIYAAGDSAVTEIDTIKP